MKTLITNVLDKMKGLSGPRKKFLVHVLTLFLALRGRINFSTLARYGRYTEKTYRTQFERPCDFFSLNSLLIAELPPVERILATDCSFLPKSGKSTPHKGMFWSGCASKALPGLEISTLALVDVPHHTALALEAVQTPTTLSGEETRLTWYLQQIVTHREALTSLATYLAADGFYAKRPFVDGLLRQTRLHLISKLRHDAHLRYLYTGPRHSGPGAPKRYAGQIDPHQIDPTQCPTCYEDEEIEIFSAVVNSKALKRNIKLAYVREKATHAYVLLFSTDLTLDGYTIYRYYHARFQIEFLFRDAKQYLGLTHCQARSEQKLAFHFNASLTSLNLAKVLYCGLATPRRLSFSMGDVKTVHFNQLLLDRIFSTLDLDRTQPEIHLLYQELSEFGKIAA